MLELLVELVFQFLFEVVAEFLLEAGWKRTARALRNRWVRYGLAVVVGFGFGMWWGDRLTGEHRPALFWVSLAVAATASVGALRRRSETTPGEERAVAELRRLADGPEVNAGRPWRSMVDPRQWPSHRLVGLAVLNGAVAAGIAVGFEALP